ncbi:MAG TPA: chromosome segregation protein SMC [Candidatus Mediterraneibacter caccavium]|uniref:Chromosome segregation protein SMC n=1 Tax=Candidatus Mediterraneibacter caccavium TaxID=2838661 RepID=A0A9D2ATJ6_9FIRM|nr:chromosome segregation protein SMC [Candidatus Mediterraneibacter caccavium]
MNFFDYIRNESFFRPLNLKYRRVYYDCIQILIDKAKELPVLYESDAKDSLTLYLRNAGIKEEGEDADEGGGELRPPEILALFRECGWLMPREIGRSGEYVVNLSTDCRRIMDFLRKISERKGEGMMSNRIFSMYEIMKSAFDEDSLRKERPYTNILVPLLDNETELKNELTDLKDSISNIMKAVVVFQDMNSFGQYIMKDEMLDRFFHEYFFIKNNGLIPAQISFIKNRLRMLRQGEIFERMIAECAGRFQMSMEEAEEKIEHYFAELQYFLSVEYEENMELIDTRINNYYNLANTRIMLMAGNGIRLEAVLNDFLNAMPELGEEKQDEAMERLSGCTRIINQKYVGYRSFEKKKRLKNEGENIGLSSEELSEEEKLAQTEELFRKAPNRYSVEKVSGFMDVQMEGQEKISIKEKPVRTKEEALMYTAAMLYAGNGEFPYQVQITDEEVEKEVADMSNIVISRK